MAVAGALNCGIGGVISENRAFRRHLGTQFLGVHRIGIQSRRLRFKNVIKRCGLISDQEALDYDLGGSNLEERLAETRDRLISESVEPSNDVQTELVLLALPAIAGQAIEPLAQLMETAYIGRLGALELASAGVSISIFNIVSKVFNILLRSVVN